MWKVTRELFYDTTPVWNDPQQVYPYRICFEPVIRKFPNHILLSDVLDLRDKGKIWTFDLGAIIRKTHNPITTAEGKELIRLLLRNNPIFVKPDNIPNPYNPSGTEHLSLTLNCDRNGRLKYESYLSAWFMRSFVEGKLKEVIGDYKDFL